MRTCSTPGCPTIIPRGQSRCTECTREADRNRGTATERGYTSQGHRTFRRHVLTRDPVCTVCNTAWSTVADHWPRSRKQIEADGDNPNNPDFGRGTCHRCHSKETAKHQPGGWNQ